MTDALNAFLPAARSWFREAFGQPTPPQAEGWPAIQRGEHTLILSPTGSGKTLAAFLWGISELYREASATEAGHEEDSLANGVRLLYVSPLKALNNDVERNLRIPLAGIRQAAEEAGAPLPSLSVLVRTGDTPQSVRRKMVKKPPHILITTPESLYLILTSPVAREMFRTVRTVIVDEIHTLVGNKRGVHLAVSLERVVEVAREPIQRIGLSATQRPLDEVARFLGGYEYETEKPKVAGDSERFASEATPRDAWSPRLVPRPVTIVDAGMVKATDLQVITPVEDFRELPGGSIWPAIIPQVMDLIEAHRTTLIFANSRRQAERAADRLNELHVARRSGLADGPEALIEEGTVKSSGLMGTGTVSGPFRAHHGSVSKDVRVKLEMALKEGQLPALVGTSSLELGIDIGAVDLVVQFQSPKGVARGLQRVGRSGHLVGQTSIGRFFPTHREDLLETAATTRAMLEGDVEPSFTPENCLDVLAQQIVAMVSVQDWDSASLRDVIRRAYPYHKLTQELYRPVLDMLSGRYPSTSFRELRPRIAWDRVHDRLAALPGSRLLAIRNGGTIPDQGMFGAYLPDRRTRIGELDEEFVYETRAGDVFTLGANTWRVLEVTEDRVIASPAPGHLPRMPFWKGDAPRRDYHLGMIYGQFRRELAERIEESPDHAQEWLQHDFYLDANSAQNAVSYVAHQMEVLGSISSDRTVIGELFTDAVGDLRLVIHSCLGARVNSPWALALAQAFREALGSQPEVMVNDDGILFRFLETDRDPPLNLIREMGPVEARERLLAELPNSALFGAQFRKNAARALLLPAARGSQKRTPFWLQRLRSKDLLAAVKGFEDFPIVAETYRDCLRDVLDLSSLEKVLHHVGAGEIEVLVKETVTPSPVASSLLFDFVAQYMYEYDQPKAERQMQALMMGREMLSQLLDESALPDLLRPEALRDVDARLQYLADGSRARTPDELTTIYLALGDLTSEEAAARCDGDGAAWVGSLVAEGRLVALELPGEQRYVLPEQAGDYARAFDDSAPEQVRHDARRTILRRVLSTRGPLSRRALLDRYPWPPAWLEGALNTLVENGEVVAGQITSPPSPEPEYCDRRNLERIHRQTLSLLRKEVEPVSVYDYADFLCHWQHVQPGEKLSLPGSLVRLLQQMRGIPAPGAVWERDLLPLRLADYEPTELEALCQRGEVIWIMTGGTDARRARVRFLFRGEGNLFLAGRPEDPDSPAEATELSPAAMQVLDFLKSEGASFTADLREGLDLPSDVLSAALVEAVTAGLVTNDTLQTLRLVLASGRDAGVDGASRKPLSSLEAELAAWRKEQVPPAAPGASKRPPTRARILAARKAASRRVAGDLGADRRWPGRWSLVHRISVWGRKVPFEERIARQARQLLNCFGIVTRQSLEALYPRDQGGWDWAPLYAQFRLMEMRGEVRRGYFVRGLPGVQFALPEAVERLREWGLGGGNGAGDLVLLNACDPAAAPVQGHSSRLPHAEPSDDTEPGHDPARFTRIPSNYIVLLRGRPVLLLELGAERLTTLPSLPEDTSRNALSLAVEHVGDAVGRFLVSQWNGKSVLDSDLAPLLERVGFRREALTYVWDGRPSMDAGAGYGTGTT